MSETTHADRIAPDWQSAVTRMRAVGFGRSSACIELLAAEVNRLRRELSELEAAFDELNSKE